jgi:FkbM family methyltransferase
MFKLHIKKLIKNIGYVVYKSNATNSSLIQLLAILKDANINLIFDIGANEGQFAKELRLNGYSAGIVSFEPIDNAYQTLLKISKNDSEWIVHERVAIGETNHKTRINISKNSVSSSLLQILDAHTRTEPQSQYVGTQTVKVVKLDDIYEDYLNVNSNLMIKIDAQGYEWNILKGATNIRKIAKVILCELSMIPLYEGQYLWNDIVEEIEKDGFILWGIQKGLVDPIDGRTLQFDAIFKKP